MEKGLTQKVEIKDIPRYGLFIYRKEIWRSIGKLVKDSYSITAQKVFMNEYGTEVYTANADFKDWLKVTPYEGELPKISKYVCGMSYYQLCLMQKTI